MKIAITGGTGFIGSHLARELLRIGHEVVIVCRTGSEKASEFEASTGATIEPVGLDLVDALARAFSGCTAVVHCAGINREFGTQTYERVHVQGTQNVIDAARIAGVEKVIPISFLRARPDCGSGYHESKWAAEEIVRNSGLDYTVIKEGITYGNGDHMISHLAWSAKRFPVFGLVGMNPKSIRPVAVEDLVKILVAASTTDQLSGQTIAVVGPEEISLGEAFRRVASVAGGGAIKVPMPLTFHYALANICERVMRVPLISKAQVRILSEGLSEPLPAVGFPPEGLRPTIQLNDQQVIKALA